MSQYLKEIYYLAGKDRGKLSFISFMFIIQAQLELVGISLIAPYISLVIDYDNGIEFFSFFINYFNIETTRSSFLTLVGIILILAFSLKVAVAYLVNFQIINFVQNRRVDLSQKLMNRYQSLKYVEYTSRNSSEYIYRIQQLTYQYSDQVLAPLMRLVSDGIVALAILSFLAYYNLSALLLLVFLLLFIIGSYDFFTKAKAKESGILANNHATKMVQFINEGIGGLKEIRILGKEKYFYEKVLYSAKDFAKAAKKVQLIAVLPKYLLELVLIFFVVSIVLMNTLSNAEPSILISTLGLFGVASIRLLPIANLISASLVSIRYARNSISLLYSDAKIEKIDKNGFDKKDSDFGIFKEINLKNINYSYPSSKSSSLKDINLNLKAGETIGIIGQSGSGKTTLVDLILGLLEASSGSIEINSYQLNDTKDLLDWWRNQIAYLPQQVFLTDDSLINNIALGIKSEDIDLKRLHESIKKASLEKVVKMLPDGINTYMGDKGIRLSGGQAQRVALARAFYHGREILIMDESTSALDNQTEKEIIKEIDNLKGKVTMIVIAHRLTTLKHCDKVYELFDGAIINSGSYEEVTKNK